MLSCQVLNPLEISVALNLNWLLWLTKTLPKWKKKKK